MYSALSTELKCPMDFEWRNGAARMRSGLRTCGAFKKTNGSLFKAFIQFLHELLLNIIRGVREGGEVCAASERHLEKYKATCDKNCRAIKAVGQVSFLNKESKLRSFHITSYSAGGAQPFGKIGDLPEYVSAANGPTSTHTKTFSAYGPQLH